MRKYIAIIIGISVLGLLIFYIIPVFYSDENNLGPGFVSILAPAGTREYKNILFKFSLFYPKDLQVKENPREGSATTLVFENVDHSKGFQIFVIPYKEDYITPEQFKKDNPSGIVKDKADITISGVPAVMFYSNNATIGDTREVWFIKNGFLFEVNTYKALDAWLAGILQTWRFLDF